MYTLLLIAVVLVFLLEPAAASNSIMDYTAAGAPIEPLFADHDVLLNPICHFCAIPFYQCIHAMVGCV